MPLSRRQIIRACKQRGWSLQPIAFEGIEEFLSESEGNDAMVDLQAILDVASEKSKSTGTLTAEIWQLVVEELNGEDTVDAPKSDGNQQAAPGDSNLQIVSAFQTPKLTYDTMRKHFNVQTTPGPLFGSVADKTNMLAQRYSLARQRILRHKLFRPSELHNGRPGAHERLTPIESLLGKSTADGRLLLLGILVQVEEGNYYLEDPTGQVAISFQDASAVDEFFVTEHCILLVEGAFHDDVLYVHRLGHPLLETRGTSLAAIQQQISHPMFQSPSLRVQDTDSSMVILSDVKLDRPHVLQKLEGLFASYEAMDARSLPLFVLMGNFSNSYQGTPDALSDLVSLVSKFPTLSSKAHFCIVPGPQDTPAHILPLPPLSKPRNHHRVVNLHMASNPCRIRWAGRETTVFCHNLLHLFQKQQILLGIANLQQPNDSMDDSTPDTHVQEPHCRLVKTILEQGHLTPVAGVPICWNYDHALQLYPLPDALVLGGEDISAQGFDEMYGECTVIHPGSMATHSSYAVYHPNREMDDDIDRMLDHEKSRVELFHAN